jgi:hypothetical protein
MTPNLQNPALAKYIEAMLKAFCHTNGFTLPNVGFIAGGFISNLIYAHIHNTTLCLNDLDLFYMDGRDLSNTQNVAERLYPETMLNYSIVDQIKLYKDKLNLISVVSKQTGKARHGSITLEGQETYRKACYSLLSSFDLNCTQAGYDLDSRQVLYTPTFESFVSSKCIEITNLTNAANTFLRCISKTHQLKHTALDLALAQKICFQPYLTLASKKAFGFSSPNLDAPLTSDQIEYLYKAHGMFNKIHYTLSQSQINNHVESMPIFMQSFKLRKYSNGKSGPKYFTQPIITEIAPTLVSENVSNWAEFIQNAYGKSRLASTITDFI